MKNCIIVTGGGTAGHIMPIIALLPELKKNFKTIIYIGSENSMEENLIAKQQGVLFYAVSTIKFNRTNLFSNFKIPLVLFKGMRECKKIYKKHNPSCIFSKGGYVSLPAVLSAGKIPVIAHESDVSFGLANKIIYKKCKVMCTNFEQTSQNKKKCIHTGIPIRNFNNMKKVKLHLNKNLPTILIIGGSLGAQSINETVWYILPSLCKIANIVHIVGKGNINNGEFFNNYNQFEFVENMGQLFEIADVVLSRSGATVLAEIVQYGKKMLLIPLPKGVSRGDQIENAKYFESCGYARILYSENLTPYALYNELELILQKHTLENNVKKMHSNNATQKIMEQILKYSK